MDRDDKVIRHFTARAVGTRPKILAGTQSYGVVQYRPVMVYAEYDHQVNTGASSETVSTPLGTDQTRTKNATSKSNSKRLTQAIVGSSAD